MTVVNDASLTAEILAVKADQLGLLNAQLAALEREAEALKKELKASGLASIPGSLYKVTIATSQRTSLDSTAVRSYLTPEQVDACTRTSTVTAITVRGL